MASKRIGILTGGGDVPGLNSVIKEVTYRGSEYDCEVIGIRRGWEGLTHLNLDDPASRAHYILPLDRENTRTVDRTGGTFLHSSRTNPAKMKSIPDFLKGQTFEQSESTKNGVASIVYDLSPQVLRNIEGLALDYVIAIGGDDTLSYAAKLNEKGVNIVAVPKTMDNDVRNTEYCIGFSTAITRATDAIKRQRTTVGSHERIGIFRVFGRDAGYTALYTAYVSSIRCCIPEYKANLDQLIDLLITDKRRNPSNYCLIVMSEGAQWEGYQVREYGAADAFGHRKKESVAEALSEEIQKRTGEETVVSDLTYDLRSGDPDFVDKLIASTFGTMALDCVLEGKSGLMAALVNGCYTMTQIPDPKLGPRKVDVATMYNTERYRPNYANKSGLPDIPNPRLMFRFRKRVPIREIIHHFNEAAADEEHFPSTIDPRIYHVQLLLDTFGDLNGKRVLDVGCGKGRFARVLYEKYPKASICGFDLAEAMLRSIPPGIAACAGSMTALPFAAARFDCAYATESLEHAVDIETAVDEICRVVKPGGRIVIIDKNAEHWGKLKTPGWEKWFHRKQLEKLLGRHCREVTSRPISYWEDVAPDGLFLAWIATK